ncbi:MAG: thiamine phosphate synthase [Cellvibrionaceae bacterium]
MITGLYAITSEELMPGQLLLRKVEAALLAGCRLVQYRDKSASPSEHYRQAAALRALCHRHGALLIVNDSVELAKAAAADGVHLGREDWPLDAAREHLGPAAIIGATCHASLDLARNAAALGANYLAFGRFFPSHTKPQAPSAQLPLLSQTKRVLNLPVVAIGGINVDNAPSLIAAGADCLAVCHDLFSSDNLDQVQRRAAHYVSLFDTAQESQ